MWYLLLDLYHTCCCDQALGFMSGGIITKDEEPEENF